MTVPEPLEERRWLANFAEVSVLAKRQIELP